MGSTIKIICWGITYQVQRDAFDRVGLGLGEPLLHAQKASPRGDVVDQKDAMSSAVETRRECPEPFLSGLLSIYILLAQLNFVKKKKKMCVYGKAKLGQTYRIKKRQAIRLASDVQYLDLFIAGSCE